MREMTSSRPRRRQVCGDRISSRSESDFFEFIGSSDELDDAAGEHDYDRRRARNERFPRAGPCAERLNEPSPVPELNEVVDRVGGVHRSESFGEAAGGELDGFPDGGEWWGVSEVHACEVVDAHAAP